MEISCGQCDRVTYLDYLFHSLSPIIHIITNVVNVADKTKATMSSIRRMSLPGLYTQWHYTGNRIFHWNPSIHTYLARHSEPWSRVQSQSVGAQSHLDTLGLAHHSTV